MAESEKVVPLNIASKSSTSTAKKASPSKKAAKPKTAKVTKKTSAAKSKPKTTTAKKKAASTKTAKPKTAAKKTAVKKVSSAKAPAKKTVKKAAVKKSAAKTAAKNTAPQKPAAKKVTARKTVKKTAAKKPTVLRVAKTNNQTMETMMTKSKNQFDQLTKEATASSRESIDAISKSGAIFAKGFEEIIRETMSYAQGTAEKQMQFAKEAMSAKTINEWSDVQNKIAQSSFDDFMSSATKISELGVKVLTDAVEPINNQMTKTVQKASSAVAAE